MRQSAAHSKSAVHLVVAQVDPDVCPVWHGVFSVKAPVVDLTLYGYTKRLREEDSPFIFWVDLYGCRVGHVGSAVKRQPCIWGRLGLTVDPLWMRQNSAQACVKRRVTSVLD